jgi:branched-chain amino acid transport system permease protein
VLGGASALAAPPRTVAAATTPTASASPSATAPAAGQDTIVVVVRTQARDAVEGATVTVRKGRSEVATGTTDARGTARLAVPGPGGYDVRLDTGSLSGPTAKLKPQRNPIATTVNAGEPRAVAFRLSKAGARVATSDVSGQRVGQLIASGLRFGLIIALAAVGLSVIFGTTGLTNFAHSELITFGALVAFYANTKVGLHIIPAALVAVVVSALFGYVNDRVLWGPLRRRGTGLIAMMIVSIGLSLFLRYLYLFFFGGSTQTYVQYRTQAGVGFGGVALPPKDLIGMAVEVVVLLAVAVALRRTRLGKATRAVSDNPALASASGINVDRVIRTVWTAGGALAGLSGVILGLAQGVSYIMGFQIVLLVFAAVTLGGLGTAFGAIIGSLIIGVLTEVSTLFIPSELKSVGALVVLILILLLRPQGILGRAQRVG